MSAVTTAADPAEETIRLESRAWKKLKANKSALFGFIIVAFFIGIAVAAPLLPIADPAATSWSAVRKAPSAAHWLGTDEIGRDILSRMIWGAQASLMAGVVSVLIAVLIGVPFGLLSGYFGGWIDLIFQRFVEIWSGLPMLYLLIILASVVEPNFWWLLGLLLLFRWMGLVGVVRVEFLRARNFDFVVAARALGMSNRRIMWRHVLPNAMVSTLTFMPFILTGSVTLLTSLDFLGFGLPPGSPSLGELLNQGKRNLQAPWLGFAAFFTLAIMLSLLVFIGEAVRDAFDPRKTFAANTGMGEGG